MLTGSRLDDGEPVSSFSHGVGLVRRSDSVVELIDKSGNVVSSPRFGEYDEIIDFIPELGMIFVHNRLVTFDLTENQAGIIDNQGNWVKDLSNNRALLRRFSHIRDGLGMGIVVDSVYLGEGFITDGLGNVLNFITGNSFRIPEIIVGRFPANRLTITGMENGYGILRAYYVMSLGDRHGPASVHSLSHTGQIVELFSDSNEVGQLSEGLFYFSGDDGRGFFDIEGNLVIDLSGYDVRSATAFQNGYSLLQLHSPQRIPFFTVIDRTGRQMFEPRPAEGLIVSEILRDGLFAVSAWNQSEEVLNIVNILGEVVTEMNNVFEFSDFNEGIAMVARLETYEREDGSEGRRRNLFFIDTVGRRLF